MPLVDQHLTSRQEQAQQQQQQQQQTQQQQQASPPLMLVEDQNPLMKQALNLLVNRGLLSLAPSTVAFLLQEGYGLLCGVSFSFCVEWVCFFLSEGG